MSSCYDSCTHSTGNFSLKSGSSIYIMGICGTAMAAIAGLLKEKGFNVRGADTQAYPPMGDLLRSLDIKVDIGYFPSDIHNFKPDLVIIGNVIRRDNPQAMYVMLEKIPYMSFPQALNTFVIGERKRYVVAGTHGKTTTTSILIEVLRASGLDPGYMVGGVLLGENKGFHHGTSPFFVLEGDEYDTAFFDKRPKFLHYYPNYLIITSLEFDHADIYKDVEAIKFQFKELINIVPDDGIIVYNNDWQHLNDVFGDFSGKSLCYTYGMSDDSFWTVKNIRIGHQNMFFDVFRAGKFIDNFQTRLLGTHNALNCLSVIALCYELGVDVQAIKRGIENSKGAKRRLEIKGIKRDITIIEDFAHHPTAIRETLKTLRDIYKDRRVIAVYEPRSNTSRRNIFQDVLPQSFLPASKVIIKDVYEPEKIPIDEILDTKKLISDIKKHDIDALLFETTDEIIEYLIPNLRGGDVVVTMSNGSFDNICERILEKLE